MTEREGKRLLEAWSDAASRSLPQLDHARLRQRVLEAHGRASSPGSALWRYWLGLAAAGVAVATLFTVLLTRPAPTSFRVSGQNGQVGVWLGAEPARELPLQFSEGTRVALGAGSRGRVSQVSPGGARVELERGSVSARVTHRPGADWVFSAGPFEVSVLGTELDLSWSPEAGKLELKVSSGRVLLRGPLVQGAQEVRAGQVCRVDLERRLLELGRVTAEAASPSNSSPPAAPPVAPADESPAPPAASANVERSATPESLLELAAAARLAGRPAEERAALLACRKRAPGQPPAARAAYLLGRASSGAEAARWFEIYLREQPSGLLAREASGRLIESHAAARNASAAAQAASRYLAAYPDGPHASMARRTLGARSESQD